MDYLDAAFGFTSKLGRTLLGEFWWSIFRDTVQDAIGAYVTLSIGGLVGKLIAGKDFSSFAVCYKELEADPTGITPYVCYGMVTLDFSLWTVVFVRLFYRNVQQIAPRLVKKKGIK